MTLTLSHTGSGKYTDGWRAYDSAVILSPRKGAAVHLASIDGTFTTCEANVFTAEHRMWVGGIDQVTCKRCLKAMESAGPAAVAVGDRYQPVHIETGESGGEWRVWDNHTGAYLKTEGGDTMIQDTEDRSVSLSHLMNERVGWPKDANTPAPVTMEHRGCHVCGKTTIRTAWHCVKSTSGEDVRAHDKCVPAETRVIEYGSDPTMGGSKFGPVVLDSDKVVSAVATSKVYRALLTETRMSHEVWMSLPNDSAEAFRAAGIATLGDISELNTATLKAADWSELFGNFHTNTPETALEGTVNESETVPAILAQTGPNPAAGDAVSDSPRYSAANTGDHNVYGVYDNETGEWQTRVGESYEMATERADAMNERDAWCKSVTIAPCMWNRAGREESQATYTSEADGSTLTFPGMFPVAHMPGKVISGLMVTTKCGLDTWDDEMANALVTAYNGSNCAECRKAYEATAPAFQPVTSTYKGKTAEEWRQMAAASRKRSYDSYQNCDTDGFVSQWGGDLMAREYDLSAQLAETNGAMETVALFDLDGNLVDARHGWGKFGEYWMLLDSNGVKVGFFSPSQAKDTDKRVATDRRKGYYVGRATVRAIAKIQGSGTGLSGATSCYATITPYSALRTAETVISITDNGQ